ncbi:MAG: hypothetical protein J7L12_03690 [Desulfurococcales archaeon]|nr:hypothetical protein [Desulfurococcales archaeon]
MYGVHGCSDPITYKSVKRVRYVAHAVAMADSLLGYAARLHGAAISRNRPLRKSLKNIPLFASS